MFNSKKCKKCEGKIKDNYDFCPYCGLDLRNPEKDTRDFGILGKGNNINGFPLVGGGGFGVSDRIIERILRNFANSVPELMKNLDKQVENMDTEVQSFPNGIQIRFGNANLNKKKRQPKKAISQEQINRMSKLPRVEGKSEVRRFSDKVVYDIKAPGIESVEDVFVSKLESGYEVKAIGKKKVYVNSLPVNLPLKGYAIDNEGLKVEFGLI